LNAPGQQRQASAAGSSGDAEDGIPDGGPPDGGSPPPWPVATRREILAWAFYDFANSGYTTVVLTTVYSAYFVAVVAGSLPGVSAATATFWWTLAVSGANLVVLAGAPVVGAIADHLAAKKAFLLATTAGCVVATAGLSLAGPGDLVTGTLLVMVSAVCFSLGEGLIAAFLPEITPEDKMGRVSGYGWSLGYLGGLLTLGVCLAWIARARAEGLPETRFVPVTLLITAAIFALAALPTFLFLRERARPSPHRPTRSWLGEGFSRIGRTWREAARFRDLIRFLLCLLLYQAGVSTVVVIAAIYAREEFGFDVQELIALIMVVNVSAAVGAFLFGHLQDRLGSVPALSLALALWIVAITLAYLADQRSQLWLAGNLIGVAMGSSQSGGRALVGRLTPPARAGEFFGLWSLVNRLAAILGPLSFGLLSHFSGDLRLAMLSCLGLFIAGALLLLRVDESRGRRAALSAAV
jgi:UMF1 family MFS transporter